MIAHSRMPKLMCIFVIENVLSETVLLKRLYSGCLPYQSITRKDMALSAISMNSALADEEFVLSLHHKLHVSTCINKPNYVHKHNQSIIHSINQSFFT